MDFASQDEFGDVFKLFNYFNKDGGGFIGYLLTIVIQFIILIINILVFYNHIVFIHRGKKISDLYLRISGKGRDYFIPDDNELSFRLLKYQYVDGEINNNRIIANLV